MTTLGELSNTTTRRLTRLATAAVLATALASSVAIGPAQAMDSRRRTSIGCLIR